MDCRQVALLVVLDFSFGHVFVGCTAGHAGRKSRRPQRLALSVLSLGGGKLAQMVWRKNESNWSRKSKSCRKLCVCG